MRKIFCFIEKINPTFTFLLNQVTLLQIQTEYGKIVSPLILTYYIIPGALLVQIVSHRI